MEKEKLNDLNKIISELEKEIESKQKTLQFLKGYQTLADSTEYFAQKLKDVLDENIALKNKYEPSSDNEN